MYMYAIKFLVLHTIFTLLVVTPLASEKGNKDDNIHKERSSKKSDLYINWGPRKSRFPLNLTDTQTDIRMEGRTLVFINPLSNHCTVVHKY